MGGSTWHALMAAVDEASVLPLAEEEPALPMDDTVATVDDEVLAILFAVLAIIFIYFFLIVSS